MHYPFFRLFTAIEWMRTDRICFHMKNSIGISWSFALQPSPTIEHSGCMKRNGQLARENVPTLPFYYFLTRMYLSIFNWFFSAFLWWKMLEGKLKRRDKMIWHLGKKGQFILCVERHQMDFRDHQREIDSLIALGNLWCNNRTTGLPYNHD